jgi:hypothetical protein
MDAVEKAMLKQMKENKIVGVINLTKYFEGLGTKSQGMKARQILLIHFENGMRAIFKPFELQKIVAEAGDYRFSKLTGDRLVPRRRF